jgi:hypothetical protein
MLRPRLDARCFVRKGAPPHLQLSALPAETDSGLEYWLPDSKGDLVKQLDYKEVRHRGWWWRWWWRRRRRARADSSVWPSALPGLAWPGLWHQQHTLWNLCLCWVIVLVTC